MDIKDILLFAQVGEEVIVLGKAGLDAITSFMHSVGGDKAKVAELRLAYAAAIAAESSQATAVSRSITSMATVPRNGATTARARATCT